MSRNLQPKRVARGNCSCSTGSTCFLHEYIISFVFATEVTTPEAITTEGPATERATATTTDADVTDDVNSQSFDDDITVAHFTNMAGAVHSIRQCSF